MQARRGFLAAAGAFAAWNLCGCASQSQTAGSAEVAGGPACAVFDKTRQGATSPAAALALLQEGNRRFVEGRSVHCDLPAQVRATAGGQAPFAAVLGCIDSRVPPELVFDRRIGDLFVPRVAGNFVNDDITGSLEFATRLAGAKLIVVLGHNDCGAIKGAVDDARLGHLTGMLAHIRPAAAKVQDVPGARDSKNAAFVQAVAERNARDAAAGLAERSPLLRALVGEGQLRIVAAMYELGSGQVRWLA